MEEKYVCPCGLNCYDCLFYKSEIYETAAKLKTLIQESKLDVFLSILSDKNSYSAIADHLGESTGKFAEYFEKFKKIPEFMDVLDGIIKIQCKSTCSESGGCSMCESTKECAAIKCVKEKKYTGCWECPENKECDNLTFQRQCYGKTVDENFKIAEESGPASVPSRGNDYYEWQRRINSDKK